MEGRVSRLKQKGWVALQELEFLAAKLSIFVNKTGYLLICKLLRDILIVG